MHFPESVAFHSSVLRLIRECIISYMWPLLCKRAVIYNPAAPSIYPRLVLSAHGLGTPTCRGLSRQLFLPISSLLTTCFPRSALHVAKELEGQTSTKQTRISSLHPVLASPRKHACALSISAAEGAGSPLEGCRRWWSCRPTMPISIWGRAECGDRTAKLQRSPLNYIVPALAEQAFRHTHPVLAS
jgi:hypothetical protein